MFASRASAIAEHYSYTVTESIQGLEEKRRLGLDTYVQWIEELCWSLLIGWMSLVLTGDKKGS